METTNIFLHTCNNIAHTVDHIPEDTRSYIFHTFDSNGDVNVYFGISAYRVTKL